MRNCACFKGGTGSTYRHSSLKNRNQYLQLARELNEPNDVRILHNTAVILQEQYVQVLF